MLRTRRARILVLALVATVMSEIVFRVIEPQPQLIANSMLLATIGIGIVIIAGESGKT